MRDLSVVMENLRLVRRARRRFIELSAVEKNCINPMLDRMADDLQQAASLNTENALAGLNPPGVSDEER